MSKIIPDDSDSNIFPSNPLSRQPVAICSTYRVGKEYRFETEGQVTRTLIALIDAGSHGVTAGELAGFVTELSAWCSDLRRVHGLDIQEIRETYRPTRYTLITPVRISYIEFPPGWCAG